MVNLLLGLLLVSEFPRKHHPDGQFLPSLQPSEHKVEGHSAPGFLLKFLSIFVHISGSIGSDKDIIGKIFSFCRT